MNGFGLTETLIGLLLASFLMAGTYAVFAKTTRKSVEIAKDTKSQMDVQKALEKLSRELRNLVLISNNRTSNSTTVLENMRTCGGGETLVSSLIPYPGFNREKLTQMNDYTAIDPSEMSNIVESDPSKMNDAIRFVYFAQESEAFFLAIDGSHPNAQNMTTDDHQIYLDYTDSAEKNLNLGDYLLISDSENNDLLRITSQPKRKTENGVDTLIIEHDDDQSKWNRAFKATYGSPNLLKRSKSYVQKVGIKTYAYDPKDKTLYEDSHEMDDDYDPVRNRLGSKQLGHRWTPLVKGVEKFQIYYVVDELDASDPENKVEKLTRTPRAGFLEQEDTAMEKCGNQLGVPHLRRIKIVLKTEGKIYQRDITEGKTYERDINPENLGRGGNIVSAALFAGPPDIITPKPPEPNPDPDPEQDPRPNPNPRSVIVPPPDLEGGGGF